LSEKTPKRETTRMITLSYDSFEKLQSIMKKRGFPKKGVSESKVIEEAIELLHSKTVKSKKEE